MADLWTRQLEAAVSAGLIESEEGPSLRMHAAQRGISPLELLAEQGIISQETLAEVMTEQVNTQRELDASTLLNPDGDTSREHSSVPAWPFPKWDRYQYLDFLGQGGMGRVFVVWDPRLQRKVAIKFYRGSNPQGANRFLREARSQARVEHDRVCKVYEVGEVDDCGYIAMRYVDGKSLGALAGDLSLHEIAGLLVDAARGLHQAHLMGLVHCDVKPSNIMIERDDAGRNRAVILDFGLAWRQHKDDENLKLAGTPAFMAPEQAQGHSLDPRTDVYGLAATLYCCITGQPPVMGSNSEDILKRVTKQNIKSPAELGLSLPTDLNAILHKGLDKDRAQRYASAAAMADDLDAFIAGNLVVARQGNLAYRFGKLLRRNKVLSSIVVTLLLFLTFFAISTMRLNERARKQQVFVRAMAGYGEELEALVRYMHLTPLHDTRPERKRIEARMAQIEAEIKAAGDLANGAGEAALGQARLALGDYEEARIHLERAMTLDEHDTRHAYPLALTLTRLFRKELVGLRLLREQALRDKKRLDLERQYQQPALALLDRVADEGNQQPSFVKALTAFHAGDEQQALDLTSQSNADSPWFYERDRLRGDLHLSYLVELDKKAAHQSEDHYKQALEAYSRALFIGPSDPELYLAEAELHAVEMFEALYSSGDVDVFYQRGLAAVDKALTALPQMPEALARKAYFHQTYAEAQFRRNLEFQEPIDAAIQLAEQAALLRPGDVEIALTLGDALSRRAYFKTKRRQNPDADLERAMAVLSAIPVEARDHHYYFNLGLMHKIRADRLAGMGGDWLAQRRLAVEAWDHALELHAEPVMLFNKGQEMYKIASGQAGVQREATLQETLEILENVLLQQAQNMVAYYYAGQCFKDMGYLLMQRGEDPVAHYNEALHMFERAAEINPRVPNFYQASGTVWFYRAQFARQNGQAEEPCLAEAEAANRRALGLYPKDAYAWQSLLGIYQRRARLLFMAGAAPTQALAQAEEAMAKSEELLPDLANLGVLEARLACLRAERAAAQGQDARPFTTRAVMAAEKALGSDQQDPNHLLAVAQAWSVTATEARLEPDDVVEALDRAECAFLEVARLAPDHIPFLAAYATHLQRCLDKGLLASPERGRAQGTEYAGRLLVLRPQYPAAQKWADGFQ